MNKKDEGKGYIYHIEEEVLQEYQKKPIYLRLKWLYMGNYLRMGYNKKIKDTHDVFRKGT
ncbi:MAG TPA: hypothetical protein PL059_12025 [Spirochaetota bacterium]|nr:hypothetical protein [Spirochaetota bacterium]HOM10957.1 hypothetical protein [Spirochaetota bacterium]HPP50643.1 hypothetical protein [Spirochaetota bacterium]HXK65863.1 hypothetical protein [Spirochaetota bacterium]